MTRPALNIIEAMDDPALFQPWFPGATWDGWRAILKGVFAIPMTAEELAFFRTVADRNPPVSPVREAWFIVGRRGGKDSVASVIAAHAAALFDQGDRLRPGERALVMCLAVDREQSKVVLNYTRSYFTDIPLLEHMVERETATGFELNTKVDVTVTTNSFRSVRGRPVLCAIFDEVAFWRDDTSAMPDEETYNALKPALASLPGSMMIGISSPYRKSGLLYKKFRDHYGRDGDVLVIKAPTRALNPTIDQRIIDEALAEDAAAAGAEWMAEFRNDISGYLTREAVDACVTPDCYERPRITGVSYLAFADPSGGSSDSMTLAIAHSEHDRKTERVTGILDAVREAKAPFSPEAVVDEFVAALQSYGISTVVGDRYAGEWPREAFRKRGIIYKPSEASKSDIYRDFLPRVNSAEVDLLDLPRLTSQLVNLERRTARGGRDSIDHSPGAHDDVANAVAGVLQLVLGRRMASVTTVGTFGYGGPLVPHSRYENGVRVETNGAGRARAWQFRHRTEADVTPQTPEQVS